MNKKLRDKTDATNKPTPFTKCVTKMNGWILKITKLRKDLLIFHPPPLFGFKMLILSGYTWVLEVLTASTQPCPRFFLPFVSSSNSPQLMEMMHTLSPIRCLESLEFEHFLSGFGQFFSTARSKKGWDLESQLDGFCCWSCFCFGWFWAFHYGVIDWLDGYEISKKEPPGMYKTGNLPTCQPQLVSWSRISEPQNSIERCHAFICWRGES